MRSWGVRLSSGFQGHSEFRLGAEPVINVVAILPATLFIECIGPATNLFFEVRVGYDIRGLLFGRILRLCRTLLSGCGAGQENPTG